MSRLQDITAERVSAELGGEMFMTETGKTIEGNYKVGELAPVIFDKDSLRFLPAYRDKAESASETTKIDDEASTKKRMISPPIGVVVTWNPGMQKINFTARAPNDNRYIDLTGVVLGNIWGFAVSVLECNPYVGAILYKGRGTGVDGSELRILKFKLTTKVDPEVIISGHAKYNYVHSLTTLPFWDPFGGDCPLRTVSDELDPSLAVLTSHAWLPATHGTLQGDPTGGSPMTPKQFRVFCSNPKEAALNDLHFFMAVTFSRANQIILTVWPGLPGSYPYDIEYTREFLAYYVSNVGWQGPWLWREGGNDAVMHLSAEYSYGTLYIHFPTVWPEGDTDHDYVMVVDVFPVMTADWANVAHAWVQLNRNVGGSPTYTENWEVWLKDPVTDLRQSLGESLNVSFNWRGAGINTGFGGSVNRSMMRVRKAADWVGTQQPPVQYAGGNEGQDEYIYFLNGNLHREADLQQSDFPTRPDDYHFGKLAREFLQSKELLGEKLKFVPGVTSYAYSPAGWVQERFELALKVGDEEAYLGSASWSNESTEFALLFWYQIWMGEWVWTYQMSPSYVKVADNVVDFGLAIPEGWWPS